MDDFAKVYAACSRLGHGPAEVDALEVWMVAVLLGEHLPTDGAGSEENPAAVRARALARGHAEPDIAPASTFVPPQLRSLIPMLDGRDRDGT